MTKPYFYVRFRWLNPINVEKVANELGENFRVETMYVPKGERDLTLYKGHREELKVRADTLTALLSLTRAILYQRVQAPFTARDMELRRRILELFPRSRITPLPLYVSGEPKFKVAC